MLEDVRHVLHPQIDMMTAVIQAHLPDMVIGEMREEGMTIVGAQTMQATVIRHATKIRLPPDRGAIVLPGPTMPIAINQMIDRRNCFIPLRQLRRQRIPIMAA